MTMSRLIAWATTHTRRRHTTTERRTFTTPTGGVFVFDRRMSDADVAAFKALWRKRYNATSAARAADTPEPGFDHKHPVAP